MKAKQRIKLFIILGVEFIAIAVMLLLIFFAGKQVHTVTFDLNGGTLLTGDPVQRVTQGHNATPPTATKEGHYFLRWSGSYREVTHDVTIVAIWEYETSPGIEYDITGNYCTISGAFQSIQGEMYVGAYNDKYKVLGLDNNAFENCNGVTKFHFLDGILTIGDNVFAGCTKLESIELPGTAISMGNNVFQGCENLKSITLPKDLKTLGNNAFIGCTALEEVVLPEGLQSIGANAFAGCENLKTIVLPSTLERVGDNAFAGCKGLEEVIVTEGVKGLGAGVFSGCEGLKSIALPASLETVGANAFAGCTALEEVSLFATAVEVGSNAFDVTEITITVHSYDKTVTEIPSTWAVDWNGGNAEITWEYLEEPVEEETNEESADESDEDEDE